MIFVVPKKLSVLSSVAWQIHGDHAIELLSLLGSQAVFDAEDFALLVGIFVCTIYDQLLRLILSHLDV